MNRSIFLFEWYSGGGCHVDGIDPNSQPSLVVEGLSMIVQLANELSICPDVSVRVPVDKRIDSAHFAKEVDVVDVRIGQFAKSPSDELSRLLRESVAPENFVLYVAPESGGRLRTVATWFENIEFNHLLCPGVELIEICESKQKTIEFLASHQIPVPNGCLVKNLDAAECSFKFPLIVKPDDGAGSDDIQFIDSQRELNELAVAGNYRVEEFAFGTPISVACLIGPDRILLLPPTRQIFANQPIGEYIGFDYPVSVAVAKRATALAEKIIAALPDSSIGYIGIDMVLAAGDIPGDAVIEINPRLTSSFCGLSQLCGGRLGNALVDAVMGQHVELEFCRQRFRYRIMQKQS